MKKILTILLIAFLGAVSCTQHEPLAPAQQDGTVTFVMGLEFPESYVATRGAMGTDPIIDDIHVALFGGEGYLNDYVQAVPCDASGNEQSAYGNTVSGQIKVQNGVLFYYKVTLLATTSERTVHVIANGPKKIEYNAFDYEVMPNLTTDAGQGAYWTMFSLPNGTSIKDPNTGYDIASPVAENAFRNLKLIRNFAKVTVTSSANNFELEGYKVFNTPAKGRIVTWKEGYNSSNARLAGYYTPYVGAKDDPTTPAEDSTSPMSFSALRDAGYSPSMPEGVSIDSTEPTASMSYGNTSQFVFEREVTNGANRPYIIVKGKFNGSNTSTFYRLDFTDKNGNYIPIFRNFQYDININSVAKAGVSNPADALPSNANVSALLSTHSLTDLADGTSRILVQYLDKTFTSAGDKKFQYIYLRNAASAISAETVTPASFRILTNDELKEIEIDENGTKMPLNTDDPAFTVNCEEGDDTWGTSFNTTEKWQEVTLTITSPGDEEKRTTFRITGQTAAGDLLYRDVTIHVMGKITFSASVNTTESSGSAVGSTVQVDLTLPSNLPSSLFPLEILFEDSNKRLNPANPTPETTMPARVGNSIVTGKTNERSYQFARSISYAEYTANNVIPCVFNRISEGTTTLYMKNDEYFTGTGSVNIAANYN